MQFTVSTGTLLPAFTSYLRVFANVVHTSVCTLLPCLHVELQLEHTCRSEGVLCLYHIYLDLAGPAPTQAGGHSGQLANRLPTARALAYIHIWVCEPTVYMYTCIKRVIYIYTFSPALVRHTHVCRLPHLCVLPRHYTDWCEQHAVGCHLNPLARKHLDETLVGGVGAVSESIGFRKAIYIYVYIYTRIHMSSSVQALYIGAHRLNTMPYLPHSYREVGIYI